MMVAVINVNGVLCVAGWPGYASRSNMFIHRAIRSLSVKKMLLDESVPVATRAEMLSKVLVEAQRLEAIEAPARTAT
ncbi:MAG: hypothetical protein RLZZ182_533 [Pseudomonadota bacterium]|jgi:hypothetical protein